MTRSARIVAAALVAAGPAAAQQWNSAAALGLVRRAIARRGRALADSGLRDYEARAHGFVFFLGAFGQGFTAPPSLIKADQLELQVYWKAPGASKQRVVGWRDQVELPTDIVYHRDHLGIVQNNFGRMIRLGGGDEVIDVPHPFSPGAILDYDYAVGDTETIELPGRRVSVVAVRVRPKDADLPRIVGTLYVDAATADLVRMTFDFTRAAYRDPELEDVSVVLDNALWEGRWWLPYRQVLEIRRRATWLDIPARGIIRGQWEIGDYRFNVGLPDSLFRGEEITFAPPAVRDTFPWTEPLRAAIDRTAGPARVPDVAAVRAEAERIVGEHALSGVKHSQLAGGGLGRGGVSDFVHVNRVEGLTLGAGFVQRGLAGRLTAQVVASYGTADRRAKGGVETRLRLGPGTLAGRLQRTVADVGDAPVISPLVNSVSAQEFGADYGDYYGADRGALGYDVPLGVRDALRLTLERTVPRSLAVTARPATGAYRPNPALGGPGSDAAVLSVERSSGGVAAGRERAARLELEGGRLDGGGHYARLSAAATATLAAGATRLVLRAAGGVGSARLPAWRSFVLGGRGTLLGEPFRAWGGRRAALVTAEWRVGVPFVALHAGPARTPGRIVLAPWVATGWAGGALAGLPWRAAAGERTSVGIGVEWLGALRLDAGYGLDARRVRVAFDVTRDFWPVL